jgi:hypothetical protein
MTKQVSFLIEAIVVLLEDGQWHSLAQIRKELCMSEDDFLKIIDFFKRFNFIDMDEKGEKVKLDACLLNLPI